MKDKIESILKDVKEMRYLVKKLTVTETQEDLGIVENMMERGTKRIEKKTLQLLKGSDGK
ncbi:hypothetical protein [Aeromonas veronii]|uniref:hypothetical protein n=1 Tax=Aeromonas veronii TaxID=654 RepID=UPI00111B84E9|nr:hypothetical protein [Aeromonas veronii]TNI42164.1 hypothetical protein CF128_00540 [Aeromonas veronii]